MEISLSNLVSQHIFSEWSKDDRIVDIDIRKIKLKSVYKLSQSEEHFEILNHPVIASFLRWKWQAVYSKGQIFPNGYLISPMQMRSL